MLTLAPFLGNVIVYGNTIDTYTTVETLLNLGVRGSYIHLVQHPPTSIITCINNYTVEGALEDALRAAGVTVYHDALLAQWNDGLDPNPIRSASFTTPTKPFKLPCSVSQSLGTSVPPQERPPWGLGSDRWWAVKLGHRGFFSKCSELLLLKPPKLRGIKQEQSWLFSPVVLGSD